MNPWDNLEGEALACAVEQAIARWFDNHWIFTSDAPAVNTSICWDGVEIARYKHSMFFPITNEELAEKMGQIRFGQKV